MTDFKQLSSAGEWSNIKNLIAERNLNGDDNGTQCIEKPVYRFLFAHASMATGSYNSAVTHCGDVDDQSSFTAWHDWTANLTRVSPGSPHAAYLYADALARLGELQP